MSNKSFRLGGAIRVLFLLALCFASPALAQQGPNLDARFRPAVMPQTEADAQNALLSGDTDIVLTRKTRLFTFMASQSTQMSDNAALSTLDPVSDTISQYSLGVRAGTTLASRVRVFADLNVIAVDYKDSDQLNYGALTATIGAQTDWLGATFLAAFQPSAVFDGAYDKRQLTQNRTTLKVLKAFQWKRLEIEPSLSISRTTADPTDYNNWESGAEIAFSAPLSKRWPVSLSATIGYSYREYDSYFADILGTRRADDLTSAEVGIAWALGRFGNVSLVYGQSRNVSTSDVNGYKAGTGRLALQGAWRF